jgi:hypothetical protein
VRLHPLPQAIHAAQSVEPVPVRKRPATRSGGLLLKRMQAGSLPLTLPDEDHRKRPEAVAGEFIWCEARQYDAFNRNKQLGDTIKRLMKSNVGAIRSRLTRIDTMLCAVRASGCALSRTRVAFSTDVGLTFLTSVLVTTGSLPSGRSSPL